MQTGRECRKNTLREHCCDWYRDDPSPKSFKSTRKKCKVKRKEVTVVTTVPTVPPKKSGGPERIEFRTELVSWELEFRWYSGTVK